MSLQTLRIFDYRNLQQTKQCKLGPCTDPTQIFPGGLKHLSMKELQKDNPFNNGLPESKRDTYRSNEKVGFHVVVVGMPSGHHEQFMDLPL